MNRKGLLRLIDIVYARMARYSIERVGKPVCTIGLLSQNDFSSRLARATQPGRLVTSSRTRAKVHKPTDTLLAFGCLEMQHKVARLH